MFERQKKCVCMQGGSLSIQELLIFVFQGFFFVFFRDYTQHKESFVEGLSDY